MPQFVSRTLAALKRRGRNRSHSCDRAVALALEPMERRLLMANIVINEFMADNGTGIKDFYNNNSDWIELKNLDATPRDLSGWHLTDNAADPNEWAFPAGTTIAANGFLLVFASGRDIKAPNGELHTNFKLSSDGEYLGLYDPALTMVSQYAPTYPQQYTDVSYGLGTQLTTTTLVGPGAGGKWLVPTSAGALDPNWAGTGFSDPSWTSVTTGLGFDAAVPSNQRFAVLEAHGASTLANVQDGINLILAQSGTVTNFAASTINFTDPQNAAGGHFTGDAAFGGNTAADDNNFALRIRGTIKITTAGQYTFGINSDDGFTLNLAGATFSSLTNCSNTSGTSTMEFAGTRAAADSFGVTTLAAGTYEFELYSFAGSGAAGVEFFSASGAKTAFDSSFKLVGDTANGGLPLLSIADASASNPTFKTAAQNVNASAFLRIPFNLTDPADVAGLTLRMKFDDGFVAYLNGQEVARSNAPDTPVWNSNAASDRLTGDAVRFEDFSLTSDKGFLLPGQNVLAIQGLNLSAGDADFLVLPQLDMVTQSQATAGLRYFVTPTPRSANGAGASDLGPIVTDVSSPATQPGDNDAIIVTAKVRQANNPVSGAPTLMYRVMYAAEQSAPMFDDGPAGGHGDAVGGDGTWTGTIPASASTPGQMVRWYVKASDTLANVGRWPVLVPLVGNDAGPEYVGTVIANTAVSSTMPIFEWFTNDTAGANGSGARASVFFLGQFYDNVFVRHRGANTTNGNKFEFNSGYDFQYATDQPRVKEMNINSRGAQDDSYIRPVLSFETFRDAGVPALTAFPLRMQLNGTFSKVADFIEQVDNRMLERYGWYKDGSLYKLVTDVPQMNNANAFEKKNRDEEARTDLSDFLAGLHLTGTAQTKFLFDNVNIPVMLDYIAANVLVNDEDDAQKNYFLYRDTNDGNIAFYQNANSKGTNEWTMLPWDKDLTFGVNFGIGAYNSVDPQAHPFFPDSGHPKIDGSGAWNWMIDALLKNPDIRQMYLRRLRTMMDEMLQPPGTPAKNRYYETRMDELFAELSGDTQAAPSLGNLTTAFNNLKTLYLDKRRVHFYIDHAINTAYPDFAGIVAQQNGSPQINFGTYDASPGSGNQDEEYLTLVNPNSVAVDISDWRLGGGVGLTFKKGTVIPAGGTLYVSPNVFAFRNRPGRSPTAIEFVQGNYSGHLSRLGETITLYDPYGKVISNITTANAPSAAQQSLRVTEVMYHPAAPSVGSPYDAEDFEFIEVKNVGATALNLSGVKLTDGVYFNFTGSAVTSLAAGEYALVVKNLAAFQSRYGHGFDSIIAGIFAPPPGQTAQSSLDNAGEHIHLADSQGETILAFDYNDTWYTQTDGLGNSLVIRDPVGPVANWDAKEGWSASSATDGSPGAADAPQTAAGAVVINEIMPNTVADPHGQWIELLNTTGAAIDIGGWYLSNDPANLKKYQIAPQTMLAANGYLVFDQVFQNALDPKGGAIYLTSASGGALTDYQVSESYRATAPEVSLGRYLTSTGEKEFTAMSAATYGAANAAPAVGPVVINEVMYHPAIGFDEFVELKNLTGSAVDLSGWKLDGGVDFTFPAGASVPANGYALIVKTAPGFFRTKYSIPAAVPIFGPYDNGLNNDGDEFELKRPGSGANPPYYRVDKLQYSDRAPWPSDADGRGASLNRTNASNYGNDVANWQIGHLTPGAAFSAFDATAPSVPVNLSTQTISPTQNNLSWSPASDLQSGVAYYNVYANGKRMASTTATTFSDIWMTAGQSRNYQVSAVNGEGVESFLSGTVLSASIIAVTPDPRQNAVSSINIVFNSPVTGFDLSDLTLQRNGGANLLTAAQTLTTTDNIAWTLGNLSGLTGTVGSYVLTLTAAGSGIHDAASAPLNGDAAEAWSVDLTGPTVSVTPIAPDPRATAVDQITIVFNEPVTSFDLADLTLKRNGGANLLTASQTLSTTDNITWILGNLGGLTFVAGTYQLNVIPGPGVTDLAGNALASGGTDSWQMTVTAQTPFDTTDDHLGTITAQGENGTNEGRAKAFDNLTSTKWLDFANANPTTRASWIQYRYANNLKYIVTQYTITSANDAAERDPKNWQLWGSNDGGTTWVTLDTRTNQTFSNRFVKNSYTVSNSTAYNVYRLNITSVANPSTANSVQLSEIELIGLPPPPPPTVVSATYDPAVGKKLVYRFSQNVVASLGVDDLKLQIAGGQTIAANGLTYDSQTNTATFTFSSLPDGNYTATLLASQISDASGSPLDGNGDGTGGDSYSHTFYVLAGDIDRNRVVDFNDLVILAQNYNTTGGMTYDKGDLNLDGNVDFNDLVIMAQNYNVSLPAAPLAASPVLAPASTKPTSSKKVFSTTPVAKPVKPAPIKKAPLRTTRK